MTAPADITYAPAEVAKLTLSAVTEMEQTRDRALSFHIGPLDRELTPLRPGELVSVIALSSNWKTGLMQYMARRTAADLDPAGNECVVYVTWEVAVEELGMLDVANATGLDIGDIIQGRVSDWDALRSAAVRRGASPIYVIGHSLARRKSRPQLTLTNVALAVRRLEDELGLRVRLSVLDYLQRMQPEGDGEPRMFFSQNVDRCKNMALATGAPVLLGCQAKQEIMERKNKIPRMNDGMETSAVMHVSDRIFTLWRPVVTEGQGGEVEVFGERLPVSDNLLLLHVAKNRFGKVGGWWPLHVDFAQNDIKGEIEYRTIQL